MPVTMRHALALNGITGREGTIPKSNTTLFWINQFHDGNLAIMPAPRSLERLEETILRWKEDGIDCVVSLLERSEMPGLLEAEAALCEEFGIEFLSFPVRDKTVPPLLAPFAGLARELAGGIKRGRAVAIHCRAGIGRSTTLAACVLIYLGVDGEVALDMIADARGVEVPETEAQRQWILQFPRSARDLLT
jgi:protein-tyrosine phosphatase